MQPHTLKSIASAAEVFSVARRQLQVAVDAANHLGLVVPDSFPDAIDHLQDWAASVEAEARGLLQLTDPANAHQPADGQRLASVATGNVGPVPARGGVRRI
jgi:hypothetical protein